MKTRLNHFYYSEQCAEHRRANGWKPTMKAEIDGKVVEFTHYQMRKTRAEGVVYACDERYLGVGRKIREAKSK